MSLTHRHLSLSLWKMVDDFANKWGSSYVILERTRGSSKRKASVDSFLPTDRICEDELRSIINRTTKGFFSLEKLTPNGSDANLFAITSLSNGDTNGVLVGCGSYIAGDLGPLQHWSTAKFHIDNGPGYIHDPSDISEVSHSARVRTVALPYLIPGTMEDSRRHAYEDVCLSQLHIRCLYQTTIQQPITVLFLELLLASNGCILSDRFLHKLGLLSSHHGFRIIVDEILTGARTSGLLLTMSKPRSFIDQVAFVTLGKWCKCGLVLTGRNHDLILDKKKDLLDLRGVTTGLNCSKPLPYFQALETMLHDITMRREKCLLKFPSLMEEESWGVGLIIFIPRRIMGTRMGTQNRLLPLLNDTPPDQIRSIPEPLWSKTCVNEKTFHCVILWTHQPLFIHSTHMEYHYLCVYHMVRYLVDNHITHQWLTTNHLHQSITLTVAGCEKATIRTTTNILRSIEKAGLLKKQMKTKRRLHGWTIQSDVVNYPWTLSSYL